MGGHGTSTAGSLGRAMAPSSSGGGAAQRGGASTSHPWSPVAGTHGGLPRMPGARVQRSPMRMKKKKGGRSTRLAQWAGWLGQQPVVGPTLQWWRKGSAMKTGTRTRLGERACRPRRDTRSMDLAETAAARHGAQVDRKSLGFPHQIQVPAAQVEHFHPHDGEQPPLGFCRVTLC